MKKTIKLVGIIALVTVIGFYFVACDDGGGNGGSPQTVTYTATKDDVTYTLKITENTSRYVAQVGDAYLLTVGTDTSSGTVQTASSTNLVLAPTNAPGIPFTVTVAGTSLTTMVGTITWDNGGSTVVNITSFTPVTPPGGDPVNPFEDEYADADFPTLSGGDDFIGTWAGDGTTYTLQLANTGTWTLRTAIVPSMPTTVGSGRFLVSGNTVYLYWHETEDGDPYYYLNSYGNKSGNTLAMFGGMTYTGGESWTKQ